VKRALAAALVAAAFAGGVPGAGATPRIDPPAASARPDRFDAERAWSLVRMQLSYGQRPGGSLQLQRLARRLKTRLPNGVFEALDGEPGLRNVVGTIPGTKPGIVIGAHYDTLADPKGFVGANNGAAGSAIVVEVARALTRAKLKPGGREIRFVLFDGEEATDDDRDFLATGVRGSKAYARRHADELRALVLLDFVADKDLSIPREAGSDAKLWARLRRAAKRVGVGSTFPAERRGEVTDDHTPFTARGVPSIDLIDFGFPCWHQACDDLSAVSGRSVDVSGEAVRELIASL
jgi:glutaminyl-peptide cyclotransferase